MNLKHLISNSTYGTIGYVASQNDLDVLQSYLVYNNPVLKEFNKIVFAFNTEDNSELVTKVEQLCSMYHPTSICLISEMNRGHNFGTADLDNMVFDYCKDNGVKWLCKAANDVILTEDVFDIEIEDADFYYMNGFSYETQYLNNFDIEQMDKNHFTPQTNFYFINVSKTDYLTDKTYLDETYLASKLINNYNGKIWEYIPGWSCEEFLAQCIERNNLTKFHLLSSTTYKKLYDAVKINKIGDPSHKNIMINGICHFQFPDQKVTVI